MRKKKPVSFSKKFPNADPLARRLLERMLAFEPKDRPTTEQAISDPYFKNLAKVERETCAPPITKKAFEFEKRGVTKDDIRERIYREILEYHPIMLKDFLDGADSPGYMYPSVVDKFKKQFSDLEEHYGKATAATPLERRHSLSLPRASILYPKETAAQTSVQVTNDLSVKESGKPPLHVPQSIQGRSAARPDKIGGSIRIRPGSSRPVVRVGRSELVPGKIGHGS